MTQKRPAPPPPPPPSGKSWSAIEEQREYLQSMCSPDFNRIHDIHGLLPIVYEKIPTQNFFMTMQFFRKAHQLLTRALTESTKIDQNDRENSILSLWKFLIRNQHRLIEYNQNGIASKCNLLTFGFILICQLTVLRDDNQQQQQQQKNKIEMQWIEWMLLTEHPKDRPISGYTQIEVMECFETLSARWISGLYGKSKDVASPKCIDIFGTLLPLLTALHTRVAFLITFPQKKGVLDCPKQKKGDKKEPLQASHEFISDTAVRLTCFYRGVSVYHDVKKGMTCLAPHFNTFDHNVEHLIYGFRLWVSCEVSFSQKAKTSNTLQSALIKMSLRPGENEAHSRACGGIGSNDANEIIENSRSSPEYLWWSHEMSKVYSNQQEGLRDVYENSLKQHNTPFFSDYVALKMFDTFCFSELRFPWISYNFISEKDYYSMEECVKVRGYRFPLIVQCVGHCLLLYEDKLYYTISAEQSILWWCVLMCRTRNCSFSSQSRNWNLITVRGKLKDWEESGAQWIKHDNN